MANNRSGFVFVVMAMTLATLPGVGSLPGQTISFVARETSAPASILLP